MTDLLHDIRYGIRMLRKDRGFTIAALLTLALCIGANTAIFSIVSSVLLEPLPFDGSDRIVTIYNSYPRAGAERSSAGIPDYFDRLASTTAFEELALYQEAGLTIGESGKPERVDAMAVTPSFFRLLRVPAERGRTFTEAEGEIGNEKRAVLSYAFWKERFGDTDPVGQSVRISGEPYTIVGVMPRDFVFQDAETQLFVPLRITPDMRTDERRHSNSWQMLGRLKSTASVEQAQAQIDAVNASNLERFPNFREILNDAGFHTVVANYQNDLIRDIRSTLYLLQIGVLMILVIGCVNIANLIMVRSTGRSRELATRAALGAGNRRLVRQLLSESVVLGPLGGVLGIAVGYGALELFMMFGSDLLPRASDVRLDGGVIAITFALSLVAGFIFGVIPALRLRGADLNAVFREEGRAVAVSRQAAAARSALVITQVALAFTMLIGAGLLLTSFARTLAVDPNFDAENVLTASINLPWSRYSDPAAQQQMQARVVDAIRAIPGVTLAAASSALPLAGDFDSSVMTAEGYIPQPGESVLSPMRIQASDGYFEAMGIPIVTGRSFSSADREGSLPVAIIDEYLAQKYFAGQEPIGKRICQCVPGLDVGEEIEWATIVGVAKTVRMERLTGEQTPGQYYFAMAQQGRTHMYLILRTKGDAYAVLPALRNAVAALDPDLPVYSVTTMAETLSTSLATTRMRTVLIAGFGSIAVLLAAIGIYGVLAYSVAQRRAEIGVRLALGSPRTVVFRLVLGQGMKLLAGGLVIGSVAALLLSGLVEGLLFGVAATDPIVYVTVAAVLSLVALVACGVPARRAMQIEPGVALRS